MKQEDYEALEERLDTLYERLSVHRRSIGFVADHIKDEQAMSSLMITHHAMKESENYIDMLLGREKQHDLEGPY